MATKKKAEDVKEEIVEETKEVVEKPYTFRKLNSTDLFAMVRLVKSFGVNSFSQVFYKYYEMTKGDTKVDEEQEMNIGAIAFDIIQIVIEKLGDCEKEIFNMLERTSNLELKELHALDIDVFMDMIVDFIKKDEFVAFSKAALRLIK